MCSWVSHYIDFMMQVMLLLLTSVLRRARIVVPASPCDTTGKGGSKVGVRSGVAMSFVLSLSQNGSQNTCCTTNGSNLRRSPWRWHTSVSVLVAVCYCAMTKAYSDRVLHCVSDKQSEVNMFWKGAGLNFCFVILSQSPVVISCSC